MGNGNLPLSRRTLLKITGTGLASIYLGGCTLFQEKTRDIASFDGPDIFPIDRTLGDVAPRSFSGDSFERPHAILWDTKKYVQSRGGMPKVTEKASVVVIGGGLSGLLSAYLLKDLNPLILEQASRLGGNARGESWKGMDYALGAAYFMEPEEGTKLRKLMREIGVEAIVQAKTSDDPVAFEGKRFTEFWEGEGDRANAKAFESYKKYLKDVAENRNGHRYPDLPMTSAWVRELDKYSLLENLESNLGGKLHPQIFSAVDRYCWSSFNACASEVSAAAGLNFIAGDSGTVWVAPGGNSAVTDALARRLPEERLRTESVVFNVKTEGDRVIVSYEDANRKLKAVEARAVIMACPKFVAKRLIEGLEPERVSAIDKIRYRSYLVANVLLKKAVRPYFYDLFLLGKEQATQAGVVDAVLADFAHRQAKQSILTLYRALPFDGARHELYMPGSYERYRAEFEASIAKEVLPVLGLSASDVLDLRLTRWGHPIPVADKGRIADKTIDHLRAPFRDRVFFVEQDNWLLPALETVANEAFYFTPKVAKIATAGIS